MSKYDYKAKISELEQKLALAQLGDQANDVLSHPDSDTTDQHPKSKSVLDKPLGVSRLTYKNLTPSQKQEIRDAFINTPGTKSQKIQIVASQLPYSVYMIKKVVSTQD